MSEPRSERVPLRYRMAERLAWWLKRHGWCATCRNTGLHPPGDPDGLGCWDCWRTPAESDSSGGPDE